MEKAVILRNVTIILAVVGIVGLLGVVFIPDSIEQYPLSSGQVTLNDNTVDYINQTYTFGFELKQGYKCNLIISNTVDYNASEAITVRLKIVQSSVYALAVETPLAPEADLASLRIRQTQSKYPSTSSPDSILTSSGATVTETFIYSYEFMGGGDASDIWSTPGHYVAILWVTNSLGADHTGSFILQASVDGQGDMIRNVMTWIGWISLIAAGIVGIAYIILNRKR